MVKINIGLHKSSFRPVEYTVYFGKTTSQYNKSGKDFKTMKSAMNYATNLIKKLTTKSNTINFAKVGF